MSIRQLEYTTGDVRVQGKELTQTLGDKIRLNNQHDYLEFLNFSLSHLIIAINELTESIDTLKSDIRQLRVGQETFVYGEKVDESDEVDPEELEDDD